MSTSHGNPELGNRQPSVTKVRWSSSRLQLLLATMNLLAVLSALGLAQRVMQVFHESVLDNRVWAARLMRYQDLHQLADGVHACGTRVFEAPVLETERKRFEAAQQRFIIEIMLGREELSRDLSHSEFLELRRELDRVEVAEHKMSGHCLQILQFLSLEMRDDANRELSAMNRQLAEVHVAIGELATRVYRIQESHFSKQLNAATNLNSLHRVSSLSMVIVVMGVTFFGFRQASRIRGVEQEVENTIEALQSSEEHTRLILNNALDAVISIDAGGKISDCNKQAEKTFGWSRDEILGKSLRETIIPPFVRSAQDDALRRWVEGGDSHILNRRVEVTAVHRNGTQFPIELAVTPVQQGQQVTYSAVLRDITERKRWEDDLCEAQRVAESAARAKSEFLANMSHEIRTPMTSIIGFADVLLEPDQPVAERLQHVQTIKRNARHLLNILNDILDVSKMDAGKLRMEKIPCSPYEIVEEVAALMRVRADEKNLQFDVRYFFPLPETISTDPTRVRQILLNLVGNAIKFTELGNVRIEVRCERRDESQPCLALSVVDTGVGLTQEQIARLFLPFEQGDNSTTRLFGGTGLGLTISQRLARLMGGDILVESMYGVGSCFTLRLPAGNLDGVRMLDRLRDSGELTEAPTRPATVSWTGRVLVAEDGRDNRRLISAFLEKTGVDVQFASNGRVACDLALKSAANGQPFDLILMDMQMPEMDGYAATARLRQFGYQGKIVAITAHAMAGDRDKCLRAGCDDYLTKPFRREDFIEKLGKFLKSADQSVTQADVASTADAVSASTANSNPVALADTAVPTAAPASRSRLRSRFADDPVIGEIVGEFVAGLPVKVREMRLAGQAFDTERLRVIAHQLKGAAGGYGYPQISDAARTVESQTGSDAARADLQSSIDLLIDLCERAALPDDTPVPA